MRSINLLYPNIYFFIKKAQRRWINKVHHIDIIAWIYQIFRNFLFFSSANQIWNTICKFQGDLFNNLYRQNKDCHDRYEFFEVMFLGSDQIFEWYLFLLQLK